MHLLSGIQAVVRQPLGGERRPIHDAAHQVSNQQANLAQLAVVQCEVQVVRGRRFMVCGNIPSSSVKRRQNWWW